MIPIYRPWLDEQEADAARRPILSGWVTQGPEVAAFESELCAYLGATHSAVVSNCTVALQLALQLLQVGPGDEVLTVSHSFIATANAIRNIGATPVFIDVEPDTFNLDPKLLDVHYSDRCKAVLLVHQIGMPADLRAILQWAAQRGVPVIEDAACAIGSEICWEGEWQKIGRPHGDIACFSFHPRKLLTTGDGGALTFKDGALAERARRLRQHAMSLSDSVRHQSSQVQFESYPEVGYNYRMTDVQAAIGRVQLEKLPQLLERRRDQVARYKQLFSGQWQSEPEWARSNWQSLALRVPTGRQQAIMQALLDRGVSSRRGIMCAHREGAYPPGSWRGGPLPHSEAAQDDTILLPLYHELSEAQMDHVVEVLGEVMACCSPS